MASTDTRPLTLNFLPGFHRESTQYSEEGKWYDGNRVRFREGKPENIRGYTKFSSTEYLNGIARDTLTWTDNETRPYIAVGTNRQLYTTQNQTQYDVSPIVEIVSVAGNFETFNNSTSFKVSLTNTTTQSGDRVEFVGVSVLNGIDINGITTVVSVSGLNHFYVNNATTATGSGSDLGTAGSIQFLLPLEQTDAIQGLGYGAGVYNAGVSVSGARAWNEPAEESNIVLLPAMWQLDTWGEDLLALRRGSRLLYLDIDASITPQRSIVVSAAPTATTFLVSPNDRHVICYGARAFATSLGTGSNPMLVRWSDQEDFTNWTPSITTTSGEVVLAEGSRIIGARRSRNAINIWTDRAMYTQSFVGPPFIFSFTQVGSNCGLIGQHAAIDYDGVSFWMGDSNFFAYDGRVQTLPCTIRRHVFEDFNFTNKEKVYAGINSEFKEIIWLYPSSSSSEPDSYVIYNTEERTWVYGKLFENGIVTTFTDKSTYSNTITVGNTAGIESTSYIYNNEPNEVYTGEGSKLSSFLESAEFDLEEGKLMMFLDRIIPDYYLDADEIVNMEINVKDYPNGPTKTKGPFSIGQGTQKVDLRARGRLANVKVSANSAGAWRWGSVRLSMQPDGDR